MGELCWSNTLDRISRPDRTLSTSLGETTGQNSPTPTQVQGRGAEGVASASTMRIQGFR